jgi:hypothetical protein
MSGQGLTVRAGLCIMRWQAVLMIDRYVSAISPSICKLIGHSPLRE